MFRTSVIRNACRSVTPHAVRSIATTSARHAPDQVLSWKDRQSKDDIIRESTEYSKTGTDDQVAHTDTAFNKLKSNDPEEQLGQAAGDAAKGTNPLDVSPANVEVSRTATQRPEHIEMRVEKGAPREASASGKTNKGGKGKKYDSGRINRHLVLEERDSRSGGNNAMKRYMSARERLS